MRYKGNRGGKKRRAGIIMRKADVQLGATYVAKVSGNLVPVRIDREGPYGGWDATNLATGRVIHIRTAARLRCAAKERP